MSATPEREQAAPAHVVSEFFSYRAVVGVTPRTKRPVRRTRYFARCSCGRVVCSDADYIDARRLWKEHRR